MAVEGSLVAILSSWHVQDGVRGMAGPGLRPPPSCTPGRHQAKKESLSASLSSKNRLPGGAGLWAGGFGEAWGAGPGMSYSIVILEQVLEVSTHGSLKESSTSPAAGPEARIAPRPSRSFRPEPRL